MTALTIRLRTDGDRIAVERLKDATGTRTASRAMVRAVREWPDLVDELAAERRKVEDLRTVLSAIVAVEAGLAEGIALRAGDRIRWTRNDAGLGLVVNSRAAEVAEVANGRAFGRRRRFARGR